MTAENSYRDFFRNNQTEMKYETKVADCNAQGDTKNVCRIHDTALDLFVSTFLLVCYVPNHQFCYS